MRKVSISTCSRLSVERRPRCEISSFSFLATSSCVISLGSIVSSLSFLRGAAASVNSPSEPSPSEPSPSAIVRTSAAMSINTQWKKSKRGRSNGTRRSSVFTSSATVGTSES